MIKKIAVITSTKDVAGMNSRAHVLKRCIETSARWQGHPIYSIPMPEGFEAKYYTTDKDSIHCENIDKEIDDDIFIFLTKHASKHEIHSLTCHPIGNFGKAEHGGKERTLAPASGILIKECIKKLKEINAERSLGFEVTTECTHHGPYLGKPAMFLEIGSTHEQYIRQDAGQAIAGTLFYLLQGVIPKCDAYNYTQAIGIGGTHYSANFQKILQEKEIAISHVIPKHHLERLDEQMLEEMMNKNYDKKLEMILVDWKGLGPHKEALKELLEHFCAKHHLGWKQVQKI